MKENRDSDYLFGLVDLNSLQSAIKNAFGDLEIDFVCIKADRESDVGLLVSVIDEVRLAGVRNYSILTERR